MAKVVIRRSTGEDLDYVLRGVPSAKAHEVASSLNILFATRDIRIYYQREGEKHWTSLVAQVDIGD